MSRTKIEGKSYTKVTRFYFRACSPLSIRVCKSETIEWEWSIRYNLLIYIE